MFKTLSLTLVAIAASATIATANTGSYLSSFAPSHEFSTEIELGLVVAEDAGVVEIYTYNNGQAGKLLGQETVQAGGNPSVDVDVTPTFGDAIALLKVGGEVVDTQVLHFDNDN